MAFILNPPKGKSSDARNLTILLLGVNEPLWGPSANPQPDPGPTMQRSYDRADVVIGLDPDNLVRTLKGREYVDMLVTGRVE